MLTRILLGPSPRHALHLVDRLGLYKTIFTILNSESSPSATASSHWQKAYDQLQALFDAKPEESGNQNTMTIIKSILLSKPEDVYPMWLLCAFVPWARVASAPPKKPGGVAPTSAKTAAQEGIKADNDGAKLIDNAASHLESIVQVRNAVAKEELTTNPLKRKQYSVSREEQGLSIREWGANWRCSVMYAILTEITESAPERESLNTQWCPKLTPIRASRASGAIRSVALDAQRLGSARGISAEATSGWQEAC